ncbi:uncharacterized protein [Salminus brasiliensis]|uniref:uncharacterized protein n=1 Tax=Salminus brasiliensis TaxID=930266 RepID=UPI003B835C41
MEWRQVAEEEEEEEEEEESVDEEQLQLVPCSPELYVVAKFSLAAYLLCWTFLTLLQRLRSSTAGPQVQEALEEVPSDPGGSDECELGPESRGWRERASDATAWHRDSWDGEDGFSALVGAEHLYAGWRLENGLEPAHCQAQREEGHTYCERARVEQTEAPTRSSTTHSTGVEELLEEHTVIHCTEDLKTRDTTRTRSDCPDCPGPESTEKPGEANTHLPASQIEWSTNLNFYEYTDQSGVGICNSTEVELKEDLRSPRTHCSQTSKRRDTRSTETVDSSSDTHCVKASGHITCTGTCTESNTPCLSTPSTETHDTGHKAQASPDFCLRNTVSTVCTQERTADITNDRSLHSSSGKDSPTGRCSTQACASDKTGHAEVIETGSVFEHSPGSSCTHSTETSISGNGRELGKPDTSLVYTTEAPHDVAGPAEDSETGRSEEHSSVNRSDAQTYLHSCASGAQTRDTVCVSGTQSQAMPVGSVTEGVPSDPTVSAFLSAEEARIPPASCIPDLSLVHSDGTEGREARTGSCASHTGRDSVHLAEKPAVAQQQWQQSDEKLLTASCSGDCGDVAETVQLNPHFSKQQTQVSPAESDSFCLAKGFERPLNVQDRERGTSSGETRSGDEGKVCEDTLSSCNLPQHPLGPLEQPVDCLPFLILTRTDLKAINSQSPELLQVFRQTLEEDRSCYSLSAEDKVEDRRRGSARSKEKEDHVNFEHLNRPSVERQLYPAQSAVDSLTSTPATERRVPPKPVETYGPLFIEHKHCQTHEQPIDALEKQTLVIDFEHKTDIDSPHSDVTVTPFFPESSATEIAVTVTLHQASFQTQDISSPQLDQPIPSRNVTTYLETSEVARDAACIERSCSPACDQWLEPSSGPESDSEDSDQTDSLHQDKPDRPISEQGSTNSDGTEKSLGLLSRLDYERYWSSEDSAVSGLGEDLDNVHCDFLPPRVEVENIDQHLPQKDCLDSSKVQKSRLDSEAFAGSRLVQVVHAGVDHLTHSARCGDNPHRHTHSSLCTGCVREADLDHSLLSQPRSEVHEPPASLQETKRRLQLDKEQTLSQSVQPFSSICQDRGLDSHCIETFTGLRFPVAETGRKKQKLSRQEA